MEKKHEKEDGIWTNPADRVNFVTTHRECSETQNERGRTSHITILRETHGGAPPRGVINHLSYLSYPPPSSRAPGLWCWCRIVSLARGRRAR